MLTIADVLVEFPRSGGAPPWPSAEPIEDQSEVTAELIESAVAAAREEALSEARATAEEELEAVRAAALVEQEAAVAEARAQWATAEGPHFATALAEGLVVLETALADTLASVLRSVVDAALADRVKTEVTDAVRALLAGSHGGLITMRGPADLLAGAQETFGDNPAVVLVEDETADITVEADDTALASHLESWRTRLDTALETSR